MVIRRRYARGLAAAAATMAMVLVAGCGSGGSTQGSSKTRGATITVALASEPPPKSALAAFTKQTGIKVKWVNIDWDSLQTKISAAASSKTYFADATDVDWSRVGQLGKLGWFQPLALYAANSIFVDGYLTTPGQAYDAAQQMVRDMGFEVEAAPV